MPILNEVVAKIDVRILEGRFYEFVRRGWSRLDDHRSQGWVVHRRLTGETTILGVGPSKNFKNG